jgi:cation diffusion facilitator CzcD-associated flavoprotein CzcO
MGTAASRGAARRGGASEERVAIVIGAGLSGRYQLHSLRDRLGLSVQVIEAADGVGGTWYRNRYPGARCDSESHSYCYLKRDIRFNTRVVGAQYDEARRRWHVTTDAGERLTAKYLITAVGCLCTANVPNILGLEHFEGRWHDTGLWPHEGVDFSGRRGGQIGTGSTGIQSAPVIARTDGHLTKKGGLPLPRHLRRGRGQGLRGLRADPRDGLRRARRSGARTACART